MRFTVLRPASAEASPCCHRPSGGDVACSVHIGITRAGGAGLALEHRLALAVSGSHVPARGTSLRRVRGRDLLDPTTSLMLQTRGEQTPSASANATVEAALLRHPPTRLLDGAQRTAGHRTHVKGFDADRVEAPRDIGGDLFNPVLAPVGLTRPHLRDRALRASSPVRATLRTGQALLQHLEPLGLTWSQAGSVQQFAGGQGCRYRNTTVDTHHTAVLGTWNRGGHAGKGDMPAAGPIAGDPVGLHTFWYWARQAEPDPANLGHPHPTEPAIDPLDVMRFHRNLSKSLVHTGFAPRRSAMGSSEKVLHCLSEIPQRLLLHGLRAGRQPVVFGAGLRQLGALIVVAGRAASRLPVLLLLDSQIPDIPGVAAMTSQHRHLLISRKQPVSRHTGNLTATTDKPPKGDAAFAPPARARGFHAATSR